MGASCKMSAVRVTSRTGRWRWSCSRAGCSWPSWTPPSSPSWRCRPGAAGAGAATCHRALIWTLAACHHLHHHSIFLTSLTSTSFQSVYLTVAVNHSSIVTTSKYTSNNPHNLMLQMHPTKNRYWWKKINLIFKLNGIDWVVVQRRFCCAATEQMSIKRFFCRCLKFSRARV